ncbi:ThiF family adenylyltransferase [Sinorhizobium fredii]|uniref:ThiF family adenylyltransferase n=1 Tax=Rhizobium fredii TaxID=380 RepID=UPI00351660EE
MTALLHPWWPGFGQPVASDAVTPDVARTVVAYVISGRAPAVTLVDARQSDDGTLAALHLDIEVERPQDLAASIRGVEPVAVVFGTSGEQPAVLALRPDFPETMHQNWTPEDTPRALCIDDRPWAEARLTFTPADFIRRIQLWLAKAARGELHDTAQPLEPLFFGNPAAIIIQADALKDGGSPAELVGHIRSEHETIIVTEFADRVGHAAAPGFVVVPLRANPQGMQRLQRAPATLDALALHLREGGIDLEAVLRNRVTDWAGLGAEAVRRLNARLALVVTFPVTGADGRQADDLRAFITQDTAGDVGVALGVLGSNNSDVGSGKAYVRIIGAATGSGIPALPVSPADVHLGFDRSVGAAVSGQAQPDMRRCVLVGAGSLGSQLAINLAREGRFQWTIVDHDSLLPHNLARHALFPVDAGMSKVLGLARRVDALLGEPVTFFQANILRPPETLKEKLDASIADAEIIIDAAASVAVSRHLADLPRPGARRLSVFFNPAGTAVVLLAEGADPDITLRDLEAQYHRLIQTDPQLATHLQAEAGIRYSGSCRVATNRIPAARAALLSAIASQAITDALSAPQAAVRIWTLGDNHTVSLTEQAGSAVRRIALGDWTVTYDQALAGQIDALRAERLPHETGGVLLGITDTSRRSIHVVLALPAPQDSTGSVTAFERGVSGLATTVAAAAERSLHQVRYVGEWHSHPRCSSTRPSATDIRQLCWLTDELESEGVPALMAIAGDDGQLSVLLAGRGILTPNGDAA